MTSWTRTLGVIAAGFLTACTADKPPSAPSMALTTKELLPVRPRA